MLAQASDVHALLGRCRRKRKREGERDGVRKMEKRKTEGSKESS